MKPGDKTRSPGPALELVTGAAVLRRHRDRVVQPASGKFRDHSAQFEKLYTKLRRSPAYTTELFSCRMTPVPKKRWWFKKPQTEA